MKKVSFGKASCGLHLIAISKEQGKMKSIAILAFCCISLIGADSSFRQMSSFVGVGTDKVVYMRNDLSDSKSWVKLPSSCCVTQIHFLRNGYMLGVGTNKNLYYKKSIFEKWVLLPNSCCVTEVTTRYVNGEEIIIGIGNDKKMYKRTSLHGRWSGPLKSSCCVKSITTGPANEDNVILGVGLDNKMYSKTGLEAKWRGPHAHTCCVTDVVLKGSTIYGIGTDKKVYQKTPPTGSSSWDWRTIFVDWKLVSPSGACCLQSLALPPRRLMNNIKIVGIGTNKELFFKTSDTSEWAHVLKSGSVKHVSILRDGTLLGVGMGGNMYTRRSIDSAKWNKVPNSCCVKSVAQMKDGSFIGVGNDNYLYKRNSLNDQWHSKILKSCCVTAIAAMPDGKLIGVGMNKKLYIKSSLYSAWKGPLANSGAVTDIKISKDGYLYGIGTDKHIYKKTTRSPTSPWRKLRGSCCVIGIAVA